MRAYNQKTLVEIGQFYRQRKAEEVAAELSEEEMFCGQRLNNWHVWHTRR